MQRLARLGLIGLTGARITGRAVASAAPTLIASGSVLVIAVGCALIYVPAGLIVGGTLGIAGSLLYIRGAAVAPAPGEGPTS